MQDICARASGPLHPTVEALHELSVVQAMCWFGRVGGWFAPVIAPRPLLCLLCFAVQQADETTSPPARQDMEGGVGFGGKGVDVYAAIKALTYQHVDSC